MDSPFTSWPQSPIMSPIKLSAGQNDKPKKPRHRHSPAQLAALNELYDKTEHPSLEQRTSLGLMLGMETKTVNAWFQNKRASTKKRTRSSAVPSYDLPPVLATSARSTPQEPDLDDFPDDYAFDYLPLGHPARLASLEGPQNRTLYAGHINDNHFFTESETMPRRMRMRPSHEQTEELRKLYNDNPHPTKEEREELGDRIGMRYQSITNWFQNQRSLAKRRKEEEAFPSADEPSAETSMIDFPQRDAHLPPASKHPSLVLPPPTSHPSLGPIAQNQRSPSVSLPSVPTAAVFDLPLSSRRSTPTRKSTPRRSSTPYYSTRTNVSSRPRRTRPEPYQLDALRKLFSLTSNPTIEQRSSLADEVNMDVGKVTNWFRNLRQTARKRAKKMGDDDDDSFSLHNAYSASASRAGTPSFRSSSSSSSANEANDLMDLDGDGKSDMGSEDDYQEAVTPSPEPSPPPFAQPPASRHSQSVSMNTDPASYADMEKFSGVKVEDALLLLSFHQHGVH